MRSRSRQGRAAFTLVEFALAISVLGILTAVGLPRLNESVRRTRVSRAAYVVATDLERALALAVRTRKPVRVDYSTERQELRFSNRITDEVVFRRNLGDESEYKVATVSVAPPSIDIAPNGIANGPFTVTLTSGTTTRRVAMLRTGLVRVLQ